MLTNATVKAAAPGARPYKLADCAGLHLLVRPNGSRVFRMKYRRGGREQLLTIGAWPETSLADARARRDQAREQLRRGADPRRPVELAGGDVSFENLARRWHDRRRSRWSPQHAADVLASLERDIFPAIGASAPAAIGAAELLELLLGIEARGCIETAHRLRERISGIFRLGVTLNLCTADPAALIRDELSPKPLRRPQVALLELDQARELLAAAERAIAPPIVKLASRFLALTAVRMAALRGARWDEVDGLDRDAPVWRIPPARMKLTRIRKADAAAEHVVPLSRQAAELLRRIRATWGDGELIFEGRGRDKPIGENAIGDLYRATGFAGRHVPHGWRATFSTILNEHFPGERQLIDQALAHAGKGKVEAAYNRARHQARVGDLFQRWADLIVPEVLALPAPAVDL